MDLITLEKFSAKSGYNIDLIKTVIKTQRIPCVTIQKEILCSESTLFNAINKSFNDRAATKLQKGIIISQKQRNKELAIKIVALKYYDLDKVSNLNQRQIDNINIKYNDLLNGRVTGPLNDSDIFL